MPPAVWIGVGLSGALVAGWMQQRRAREALAARRRSQWGRFHERDRDMGAISAYHAGIVAASHGAHGSIDDRTWEDLNLDSVFAVIDRTTSTVGQQVLYSRLRTAPLAAAPSAFEALVSRFDDVSRRERTQAALAALTHPSGFDVWRLTERDALQSAPWHVMFPVLGAAMLTAIVLVPFWPPAFLVVVAGTLLNLFLRGAVAKRLRPVTGAFRQVGPLLAVAVRLRHLHGEDTTALTGRLAAECHRLRRLRRIAGWAGRDGSAALFGDLSALAFEYLNLLFFLDASVLFFGARELRARSPELLGTIAAVGEIDAAVSIASYRAGTPGWTRPRLTEPGTPMRLVDLRHPLLPDAVPCTVTLGPPHGVIVTGSNMSGKSTFLRTVGVTAVLAQTINTVIATAYEAPVFVVRSCIGRADDPATGRSYYLMEVDAVLDLVHAASGPSPHLMLFDELFRGTNTVERIAAGEAVLAALAGGAARRSPAAHIVVAATHDQELVDLLDGRYTAFHFADRVDAAGLAFDYQLRPGPATTRNAIVLLRMRGAPADLVERALARAAALDDARQSAAGVR
jgi:hypothetical protein